MGRAVRFLRVQLSYGCHGRDFELPDRPEPVVIAGPNGAGKSTLIEGVVRVLFGFNRRTSGEGSELEWRQPWSGEPARGRVELRDATGELALVEREFGSNDVALSSPGGSTEIWRGDGNPAATNASAVDFKQRLRALIGFERLDSYELTAYVRQGGLLATRIDESLLRAAAGSPIDVARALLAIEQDHRRWTREPVAAGRGRAQKPRERELVVQRIEQAEAALAAAQTAERERAPLLAERERLAQALEGLSTSIAALESAQLVLVRRDALRGEMARLEDRLALHERQLGEIEHARAELSLARARLEELGPQPELPEDFTERAAALEQLWASRERAELRCASVRDTFGVVAVPSRSWTFAAAVVAASGAIVWIVQSAPWGAVILATGLATVGLATLIRRSGLARQRTGDRALAAAKQELDEIARAIERQLEAIPDRSALAPATLGELRARFVRKRAVDAAYRQAAERHDAALRRIAAAADPKAARTLDEPRLLDAVQRSVTADRNAWAEKRLRLDDLSNMQLALPADLAHELPDVQRALEARRSERSALEHELRAVTERLAQHRKPHGSFVLEDELVVLRQRVVEIDEAAEACRTAYELLDEAHREFRDEDQRRLVDRISAQLLSLSSGALGPLEATGDLDQARLHAFGRQVPLDHRPLSYGQLHLVLLAVRLGAADFMTRWGISVPLIVDEPFANLDDDNAAAVWSQLRAVARERQVIVATQDSALLDRLGIRSDVTLGRDSGTATLFRCGAAREPTDLER